MTVDPTMKPPPDLAAAVRRDPELQRLLTLKSTPLATFQPRPDRPDQFDEQTGFVTSRAKVSVLLGGNGSGKSTASAYKVARFLTIDQPPPRPDTPFWVISDSLWQTGQICWSQGLAIFIPVHLIDWDRVKWQSSKLNWPSHLPLRKWPGTNNNWMIEFRSTESGRQKFQGVSVAGAWFSEQFEWTIFEEVLRGFRDSYYDGGIIIEATPIDPDLSIELEALHDEPPDGWAFYRLNTDCNKRVSADWRRSFFASISEEQRETRRTGAFASFRGSIFKSFNPKVHLVGDAECFEDGLPPKEVRHRRGIDWGESADHPFACVWGYVTSAGNWHVYDEMLDKACLTHGQRAHVVREKWPWDSALHGYTYADPSRPMLIADFNRRGIWTQRANNAVHDSIEYLRSLLKINPATGRPRLFVHKGNCPNLVKQLRKYRWLRSSGKGLNPAAPRPEPLKRDDDLVDALRYMVWTEYRRETEPPSSTKREETKNRILRRYGIQVNMPPESTFRERWNSGTGFGADRIRPNSN